MIRFHFSLISICGALLFSSCVEHDSLIPDITAVVDSVAVASTRGPGSSGTLIDLWGDRWKFVAVLNAQVPVADVVHLVAEDGAEMFRPQFSIDYWVSAWRTAK